EDRGEIVANRVGDRVRRRFPARCAMLPAHVTRRNGLSSRPCGLRLPSRAPQETRPAFHAFDYTDVGRELQSRSIAISQFVSVSARAAFARANAAAFSLSPSARHEPWSQSRSSRIAIRSFSTFARSAPSSASAFRSRDIIAAISSSDASLSSYSIRASFSSVMSGIAIGFLLGHRFEVRVRLAHEAGAVARIDSCAQTLGALRILSHHFLQSPSTPSRTARAATGTRPWPRRASRGGDCSLVEPAAAGRVARRAHGGRRSRAAPWRGAARRRRAPNAGRRRTRRQPRPRSPRTPLRPAGGRRGSRAPPPPPRGEGRRQAPPPVARPGSRRLAWKQRPALLPPPWRL